jgi:sialic acid synthase SpsE
MYEMFKRLEFTEGEWITIANAITSKDMGLLATVDYIAGVELALSLGVQGLKLSAWDIRNFPLIKAFAQTRLPILIDLGPALLGEIVQVMDFLSRHDSGDVILLHGTHGDAHSANFRTIPFLKETFEVPVGWTADQADGRPDLFAYAVGADVIEKRLTLDKSKPGHHNLKAMEPAEFKGWLQTLASLDRALGTYGVYPSLEDLRAKDLYFTSIVAARDIAAGEVITEDMLAAKRPGRGISPLYIDRFVGRQAKRDFKKDEGVTWDAV